MAPDHAHGQHNQEPGHDHGHGHDHDKGLKGMLRYLRFAPEMWRSEVNEGVVARLALQPSETAMDIGAGIGAGTIAATATGCRVVAVEPTPYMRRILGLRRLMGRVGDQVRIVDGTAEATTVEGASIDAVWAVNTMHHWTDQIAGCREIARILAPGGRVLLVDEDFDDATHPDYDKFGSKRKEDHSHHFETADADAIAAELRRVGLTVGFAGLDQIAGRPSIVIEASAPT